jgi:ferritin
MLNKAVQDAINEQIKNELYSAYLYLSMAAYCESINLPGFAHWMRRQYEEEVTHGLKFFDYLTERGARVTLKAIDQPPADFKSPLAMFQQTLEHEQKVTGLIHDIYALAVRENDYASQVELQWFIKEQVEEEKSASEIVEQLKMMGEHAPSLIMMDRHLGSR